MTTLLLVDDPHLSLELQRRLGDRDIKVISVSSGLLALEMIRKLNPSLIILGYELEDLPGPEVHRHIKKNPKTKNIPLIILYDPRQGNMDAVPQGPQDETIRKPVDTDVLVKRVADHLSLRLRRHNRIAIQMEVQWGHGDETLKGFARNISESGMFIETDAHLPKDNQLTLSVTLPGQSEPMKIPGKVARCIELEREFRYGLGIQFEGLEAGSRDRIIDFLVQKSFQVIA
jgi:uncharacterized protein (TIGR02266 family)